MHPQKIKLRSKSNSLEKSRLGSVDHEDLILGDDFNTIFDSKLGKKGGNMSLASNYIRQLQSLCESFNLIDVWGVHNPTQKKPVLLESKKASGTMQTRFLVDLR